MIYEDTVLGDYQEFVDSNPPNKEDIKMAMADTLFVLVRSCSEFGISFDELMEYSIENHRRDTEISGLNTW